MYTVPVECGLHTPFGALSFVSQSHRRLVDSPTLHAMLLVNYKIALHYPV